MMTRAELIERNKDRQICQICVLTRDLKKTMDAWIEYLEVGPWKCFEISDENTRNQTLDGKKKDWKFKQKVALAMMGNVQIEIVEPCYGMPIYSEFLEKHGDGEIHHFKERFTDEGLAGALKDYEEKGMPCMMSADFYEASFAYVDSVPKLGFFYELGNYKTTNLPEGSWYLYPED